MADSGCGVVFQRFLSLGTQGIGRIPCYHREAADVRLSPRPLPAQECGALLVEVLVLVLELVALLLGFGLFRVGIAMFFGDPLSPRVNGTEDGL